MKTLPPAELVISFTSTMSRLIVFFERNGTHTLADEQDILITLIIHRMKKKQEY